MGGIIYWRRFFSQTIVRLDAPLGPGSAQTLLELGYFLLGRFAIFGLCVLRFLLEIPLHLFFHSTESFARVALRGPLLDYQEAYSSWLRRQRLAIVSVLGSVILLVAQLTYFGYTVVESTIPTRVTAQSGTIDIYPSWDGSADRDELWALGNPCTVESTTYTGSLSSATTLFFGKDISDPTDCSFIENYHAKSYRTGIKFSLADIPNNATITGINLLVNVVNDSPQTVSIRRATSDAIDTLSQTNSSFVAAIENGTEYATILWSTTGLKNQSLGATAVTEVQSRISGSDILPVGLMTTSTVGDNGTIYSVDQATPGDRPILRVTYTIPPLVPTGLTHTANTTATISWSWTDNAASETRYDVRDGTGNVTGCTNLAANTTSCTETGLSANTRYTRTVRATDAEGTADSSSASTYTSQNTPTSTQFTATSSTSHTVSAQGTFPNLTVGGSGLYFEESVTATNSGWMQSTSWVKSGLSPNTQYSFRSRARNGDGDETPNTSFSNGLTAAASPSVTSNRTTSTWYAAPAFTFTNAVPFGPGGVSEYRYLWNTVATPTFSGPEPSWNSGQLTTIATSDQANWYLHLQAYDQHLDFPSGGAASFGPYQFDGTAPTAPTLVNDGTGPDISSQTSTTSLSANWTASTDAASGLQKYQYAIGTTSGGTEVRTYTDNGPATSVTASGLSLSVGTTYYVSARAVDAAGNISGVSTSNGVVITTTTPPTPSDTTGPVISSVSSSATSTTATIRWTTDEAATAKVEYGLTAVYGGAVERTTLVTDHQLTITGLTPDTTYHFRITSADASGHATQTSDDSLTTVAAPIVSQGVTGPTLLRPVVRDGANPSIIITGLGKGNQTITFYVNDRAVSSVYLPGELTDTKSFAVKLLANIRPTGKYTVTAIATQSDGRTSQVRQRLTFRIKTNDGEKFVQPLVTSTYIVHAGDTLWKIAARMLGDGNRWEEIASASARAHPSLLSTSTIYAGWALTVPAP